MALAEQLDHSEDPQAALKRQTMICHWCKEATVVFAWLKPWGKPATLEVFDADLSGLVLREDGWFAAAAGGTRTTHDKTCPKWPARIKRRSPHFGFPNEDKELKNFHDAEQGAGR